MTAEISETGPADPHALRPSLAKVWAEQAANAWVAGLAAEAAAKRKGQGKGPPKL